MSLGGAEPFDRMMLCRLVGNLGEVVENVVEAHLPQAAEQRSKVVEHDARFFALLNQLRDDFPHPLIAPVKSESSVVIADVRCSIMYWRLLIIAAVRRSSLPAGISG